MNIQSFDGMLLGAALFLIIGLFHPVVIKAEYYVGTRIWPLFALSGAAALGASLFTPGFFARAILGVIGCSLLWCIVEVFHQKKRVEKGWYPRNPKRGKPTRSPDKAGARAKAP
jgi:hypothetical protein